MLESVQRFIARTARKMRFLPSEIYVKYHYNYFTGKKLNLENPREFNEKVEWYKVYYRPKILTQLADKYEVRSYVEQKIGTQYLNELYAVYDNANAIDFDSLPNQFVVKANHTNNHNLIVKDKKNLDREKAIKLLNKWLKKNQYYRRGQEWAYKDIKPKLVIEKFLKETDKNTLVDYKFYCFNGKPKFIDVHMDREDDHKQGCFDLEFNLLPFGKSKNYKSISSDIEKPSNLSEMIELSEQLADDLPFVRVDFYSVNGKSIFGEMTFYPSDARNDFYPDEYNTVIGDYFILPKFEKGQKIITK
ncbi:MAG: ATP-grasp fold amidoligase family protein [Gelidibacter sp.]